MKFLVARVVVSAAMLLISSACSGSHSAEDVGVDASAEAGPVDASGSDSRHSTDAGPPPVCPDGACEVEQVVAGIAHSCARLTSGRIVCWGSNLNHELGREGIENSVTPVVVDGLPLMARLMRGHQHVCGISVESELWCWGDGNEPLLRSTSVPSRDWVPDLDGIVDVQIGTGHACALLSSGATYCWGVRNQGQLGDGTREISLEPVRVVGLDDVVELAVGAFFNCARTAAGRLACWGDNSQGQIGDGTGGVSGPEADRLAPVFVLDDLQRTSVGGLFACALTTSGEVKCWGANERGQLGIGSRERYVDSPTPVLLPSSLDLVAIEAGTAHACALAQAGHLFCWGDNSSGSLGIGSSTGQVHEPEEVRGIDEVTDISLGYLHTCAIRAGREVWCWGRNDQGQLGDGTLENRDVPVRVLGFE